MSQNILNEVTFFAHSFLLGIVITIAYDGFVVLRRVIRHNLVMISLEDMIFWIACAIGVFYMLVEENNGILRWFAVFGATLGMLVYKESVSDFVVNAASTLIRAVFRVCFCILRFLFRPIRFVGRKFCHILKKFTKKGQRAGKYAKNKLTRRIKLLKMILCKHKERKDESYGKKSCI